MTDVGADLAESAVVFAPVGRDAAVAVALLAEAGIAGASVATLADLVERLRRGAGFAIVTEEALRGRDLRGLAATLAEQAEWSDFPFILLTGHGGNLERNPVAARLLETLGNVTFLERPFHPTTLVSLSRAALRARRRQYEARARLATIRRGEERLRIAMAAGNLGAWRLSLGDLVLETSPECRRHFGRRADEALSYGQWVGSIHPDDKARVRAAVTSTLNAGRDYDVEYRCLWPDGSEHWVQVRGSRDSADAVSGVSLDITAQRAAEAALQARIAAATAEARTSEARLRSIFETSYQFFGVLTPTGILVDANAASLAAIDSDRSALVGRAFAELPWFTETPGAGERAARAVAQAAAGANVRHEVFLKLASGWRCFDFSLRPVRDGGADIVALVAEAVDITDRRDAEESLRQSQKLETIGQLTGGVAHDVNNLLTPIVGSLDLLGRMLDGDARAGQLVAAGLQSAERAKTLVNRLLSFARRQTLEPRPVDVAALVRGMSDLIQRSIGPMLRLEIDSPGNVLAALADPNQLELSLLNLCVNARDAMPDGGRIIVRVAAERLAAATPGLAAGDYIRIDVVDTGVGMDAETASRAAEPFFTTKAIGAGTGLGLSMVHGLVAQLGGGMAIASAPGAGTTVTLRLRATEMPAPAPLAVAAPAPTDTPQSAQLLLVDDEILVRFATAEMLRDAGFDVTEAASGSEAQALVASGMVPDLLVTDQLMPGMKGTELADRLRRDLPALRVLVTTGYADSPEIAYPRLGKPYGSAELIASVRALVETRAAP